MFLRGRQRLSFHDPSRDRPVVEAGPHVTIYAGQKVCEGSINLLNDWNTEQARQVRDLAAKQHESRALERRIAAADKKSRELKDAKAKLERIIAMSPEEREQHRDEIEALLARYS